MDHYDRTVQKLSAAVTSNNLLLVNSILSEGVITSNDLKKILELAVDSGKYLIVELLVKHGVDTSDINLYKLTNINIKQLLLSADLSYNLSKFVENHYEDYLFNIIDIYIKSPGKIVKALKYFKRDDAEFIYSKIKEYVNKDCDNLISVSNPIVYVEVVDGKVYRYCFSEQEFIKVKSEGYNPLSGRFENFSIDMLQPASSTDEKIKPSIEAQKLLRFWRSEMENVQHIFFKIPKDIRLELARTRPLQPIVLYRVLSFQTNELMERYIKKVSCSDKTHCDFRFHTFSRWSSNIRTVEKDTKEFTFSLIIKCSMEPRAIIANLNKIVSFESDEYIICPGLYRCQIWRYKDDSDKSKYLFNALMGLPKSSLKYISWNSGAYGHIFYSPTVKDVVIKYVKNMGAESKFNPAMLKDRYGRPFVYDAKNAILNSAKVEYHIMKKLNETGSYHFPKAIELHDDFYSMEKVDSIPGVFINKYANDHSVVFQFLFILMLMHSKKINRNDSNSKNYLPVANVDNKVLTYEIPDIRTGKPRVVKFKSPVIIRAIDFGISTCWNPSNFITDPEYFVKSYPIPNWEEYQTDIISFLKYTHVDETIRYQDLYGLNRIRGYADILSFTRQHYELISSLSILEELRRRIDMANQLPDEPNNELFLGRINVQELIKTKDEIIRFDCVDEYAGLYKDSLIKNYAHIFEADAVGIFRFLVETKAIDINAEIDSEVPLDTAIADGSINIAKYLLESGVKLFEGDDGTATTLEHAINNGNLEMVKLIFDYGAKFTYTKHMKEALEESRYTDSRIIQYIIDNSYADKDEIEEFLQDTNMDKDSLKFSDSEEKMDIESDKSDRMDIGSAGSKVDMDIGSGNGKVGMDIGSGVTQLNNMDIREAVRTNNISRVKSLINKGLEPEDFYDSDWSLLDIAISNRNIEMVVLLLKNGIPIVFDDGLYTIFNRIHDAKLREIYEILVQYGLDEQEFNEFISKLYFEDDD